MKKSKVKKPRKKKTRAQPELFEVTLPHSPAAVEEDDPEVTITKGGPEIKIAEVQDPDYGGEKPLAVFEEPGTMEKLQPLQRYLMEARRYPILTREEEVAIARQVREEGDVKAAHRLVISNLRLVVKIAIEYQRHWTDLFDLVQEGNIGLLQAVKKFDPYRGIRFSTYASFWIRAYILKFLMENYRLVKIGKTQAQRRLFFNLRKEKERLETLGFRPTSALLAKNLLTSEKEINEMQMRMSSPEESLDNPVSDDGKQTLESTLPDHSVGVVEEVAEGEFKSLMTKKLKQFRKQLAKDKSEKELYIFDNRMLAETPQTLQEVGAKFKISRERVRQIEARILKRLKEYLKQELPDFEDYDFLAR